MSTTDHASFPDGAPSGPSAPSRPTLAFVHTVVALTSVFGQLAGELLPETEIFHIVDESLLGVTRKTGHLSTQTKRRVLLYVMSAVEGGADMIVVTCSSIGPAVDVVSPLAPVPVLRIDEAMADEAARLGTVIGVLATLSTTLEPTAELVSRRARATGKPVQVVPRICEGAFEALLAGDRAAHDLLVGNGITKMANEVDVVVLAQASMARVAEELLGDQIRVPVLSSPSLGMRRVAERLSQISAQLGGGRSQ